MKKFLIENTKNKIPKNKPPLKTGEQMFTSNTMGAKNPQFTTKKPVDNFYPNIKTQDVKITPEVTAENAVIPVASDNRTFYKAEEPSYLESLSNITLPRNSNTEATLEKTSNSLSTNFNENTANIIDLRTEEYLNALSITEYSMPDLLPSAHFPMCFTQQKHFEGALAGAFVTCLKQGMTQEEAYIIAAFQFGSAGSNITILQTLSKSKFLKPHMNMLPYLPSLDSVPEIVRNKLAHLPTHEFMFCYETMTMLEINQDLHIKLEFYQEKTALRDSPPVQNLTGNNCPDFVRNFQEPIDTIKQEAYDQKSLKSSLSDNNHIRPVSGNLENQTNKAVVHLVAHVEQWLIANEDKPATMAKDLLNSLTSVQQAYMANQDSQLYASSYNQLRNVYGEFLIQNRIPMNLVTEVSIQKFTVNPENSRRFRELFIKMYYSSESPWLAFANTQVQNSNAKNINYDSIIKDSAESLFYGVE